MHAWNTCLAWSMRAIPAHCGTVDSDRVWLRHTARQITCDTLPALVHGDTHESALALTATPADRQTVDGACAAQTYQQKHCWPQRRTRAPGPVAGRVGGCVKVRGVARSARTARCTDQGAASHGPGLASPEQMACLAVGQAGTEGVCRLKASSVLVKASGCGPSWV